MTNITEDILCTKSHEYILPQDSIAKIGITDFAVGQLGDIVFVELPEVGTTYSKGEVFGTIESVKAASELYIPISGTITEVNEKLSTQPELINEDCYGEGWIIKVNNFDKSELSGTMSYKEYKDYLEKEE